MIYVIKIRGEGPTGNNGFEGDVESVTKEYVDSLASFGHEISYARIGLEDDSVIWVKEVQPQERER